MASTPPLFRKPPKTLEEQAQILVDRGVVITDFPKACSVLGRLNSLTPTLQRLGWPPDRLGTMIWIIADLLSQDSRQQEAFISRLQYLLAAFPDPYSRALGIADFQRVMK